ncbi:MAG: secretion protein F [Lachnospiraceae bacterium]|nr:secretion protein F [Lachnospiraceae bacterium]
MVQAIIGILCGIGLFFVLADVYRIPYFKTSKAVESLSKKQKDKTSGLNLFLSGIAEKIAKRLKLNEFKRAQLEADLKTAQMDISPEMFKANALVKAGLIGVLAIPVAFIFPLFVPVVLFLAVFLYRMETKSVSKRIKAKRERIEYELPRLVSNIEKTLAHNRDVLYMLESYAQNAGPELKHELEITVADMKSGNYEGAITRLESRVGSSMMSDVCRGLIGILRGDDNRMYWASLSLKFNDTARQQLRLRAQKVPRKVKRLSMCLLLCFMLIYIVVILEQIMMSIGVLFQI